MRIAIFSDSLPPRVDGIAVAVQQLTIGLIRSGHEVLLVGPGRDLAHAAETAQLLRLPSFPTLFDGYPFTVPLRLSMRRALQQFRPDVVSAQTAGPIGLIGLSLARQLCVPSLFSWHTDFEAYGQSYWLAPRALAAASYLPFILDQAGVTELGRAARGRGRPAGATRGLIPASLRRASRWMSAVCAPSIESADQVRRFGLQRPVFVMPADITPEDLGVGSAAAHRALQAVPEAGATPYLLFIGRLSREKNLELLLEAFVRRVPAPTRLVLVGPANDARMRSMLSSRATALPGRIVVTGALPRSELGEIYRSAAAFVTASMSETQCLCICEAVALDVPVLVVDPHLAKDRPPGAIHVVPPNADALGGAMAELSRPGGRPRVRPTSAKPMAGLAIRFAAATDSVVSVPSGATLHWDEGRWITV